MAARPDPDPNGVPLWMRLQTVLGLAPLTLFAAFHLWLNWPALAGREAWLTRVRGHAFGMWFGLSVLAVFAVHAGLGVLRARRATPASASSDTGRSRFQIVTGALLVLFLIVHLTHVWPASTVIDSYERLWQLLGRPVPLATYVLGCAALAFHLAHGWVRAFEARLSGPLRMGLQYTAGAAGLGMFLLYLQLLGWFAAGEAVVPLDRPASSEVRAER